LAQAILELGVLLAQRYDLPLRNRNRMAAVRVRDEDFGDEVGVVFEERRVFLEVSGDGGRIHSGHSCRGSVVHFFLPPSRASYFTRRSPPIRLRTRSLPVRSFSRRSPLRAMQR